MTVQMPWKTIITLIKKLMKNIKLNLKLKTKLIISHLLIASVPLCILLIICTTYSVRALTNLNVSNMAEISNILTSNLNTIYQDAYNSCQVVADNVSIQGYLQADYSNLSDLYSADLSASLELTSFQKQNKNLSGLYVIGSNQLELKSSNHSFLRKYFPDEEWFAEIINADSFVIFPPHEESYIVKTVDESLITLGLAIYDKSTGQKCGVVLAEINTDIIYQLLDTATELAAFLIVDENNQVLLESNRSVRLEPEDGWTPYLTHSPAETIKVSNKQYRVWADDIFDSKWKLISISDVTSIRYQWLSIFLPIILITTCIILLIFCISYYYSKKMLAPLMQLRDSMRDIQSGDLCVKVPITHDDEIGELCTAFNDMVSDISSLTNRVYQSQELLRESELKALQAQINPHFLYNSLDSVIWLMRLKRQEEAITMLSALSKLFRIALSKGNDLITVQAELEHVKNYLLIQSMRYKQKLVYHINYDPAAASYLMPKLILQPLVENCIYHAYAPDQKQITITITIKAENGKVIFSICDDGQGIEKEQLELLNHYLSDHSSQDNSAGYGLKNIYTRLQMYFTSNCTFTIDSIYREGTYVNISIPQITEKGEITEFNTLNNQTER